MSNIVERIGQLIKIKEISVRSFEQSIGASNGSIGRAISKRTDISAEWISKIIDNYPDVNTEWLVTGNGEILKNAKQSDQTIFNTKIPENGNNSNVPKLVPKDVPIRKFQKMGTIAEYPACQEEVGAMQVSDVEVTHKFPLRTDRLIERQSIPIYDMEAVAGLVPLFTDQYSQRAVEVMETTLIPKCDGGLRIVGDSMYPLLKSGDIVFYKQIHDVINNIMWGEMYLISFDLEGEEYVSVKYLQKSEEKDHVTLASYNGHHGPQDIPISRIRALAFIKASLRLNSIK